MDLLKIKDYASSIDAQLVLIDQSRSGNDPNKKTVLVYGHLDVQPAAKEGPVIAWIHAISVLQKKKVPIPVNLKFVFECMEESGSQGLEPALQHHKDSFLTNVDMTCISDNYWLGKNKPCLTYGLRGLCYYFVEISCAKQDLHSGTYGGSVPEAMNDMVWILSQLIEKDGTIKIPHIYGTVAPLTEEEKKTYEDIDFCLETYQNDIAAHGLLKPTKAEILMNRWRFPSLSIHGIEGAFSGSGAKTVIPSKVIGKFSIRLVPNMTPEVVDKLVLDYLNDLWAKRGSPNHFHPFAGHSGMPWLADYKDENFRAGARAMKRVFGVDPDYTREGGSIPITLAFQVIAIRNMYIDFFCRKHFVVSFFQELTGRSVMLLPIGACDDMAHSQNEKLDRSNYIKGTKTLAAYLLELAG
ncbi:peptidase dimerization domain protein [Necator americanus]|uniref:Peptidase dimerization domain protein n=1 Tax=Necator americanus TaxID=51031 RepID=W2TRM9_NECAM|nr:peptidase dimerization domain protein [Necator americanus]ETN84463.1 peptidase dimerization domain protein [Necator americanus]